MDKKAAYSQKLKDIQGKLKGDSKLLLVSKTRPIEDIQIYYDLGQRDFGENRVQELSEKSQALKEICPEIRWHMIGNLQTNKINQLFSVEGLWAIHSVADTHLLEKLLKAQSKLKDSLHVFLQFNTSKEEEKSGFEDVATLKKAIALFPESSKIKFYGLMTMGTLRTENFEGEARRCFQELNSIRDEISPALSTSMGMSQDYQIALEEKSNWIRLGTMMFL